MSQLREDAPRVQPTVERSTGPTTLPVTLAEAKAALRLSGTHHDAEIQTAIEAATEHVEHRIDRNLCSQSFEWSSDRFPVGAIGLPHEPVQSVTSITYDDSDGNEQTLDPSLYGLNTGNRQVYRKTEEAWPEVSGYQRSVRLEYVTGYGDASAVPRIFKRAILGIIEQFFYDAAMEKTDINKLIDGLLAPYMRTGYE